MKGNIAALFAAHLPYRDRVLYRHYADKAWRDFTVGELLSSASPAILPLIGNGILFGIAVGIGLFLLIIPGLWLLTIWAVVAPANQPRSRV